MTLKRVSISLLVVFGALLLAGGGAIVWLMTADLRPWVEDYAAFNAAT